LLISADRNPYTRGALVTGLIKTLPSPKLTELAAQIDADQVKTIISVGEDLAAAGLTAAQLAKTSVIYLGTHANPTADAAKVVLPMLTVFEKSGTFINQQFRLQKFAAAVLAGDLVRVHTVDARENPLYHKLLHAAGESTGLPVLYNTSFNLFGEPLVCGPRDAVRSFYSSGIDAMFVGHFFLQK